MFELSMAILTDFIAATLVFEEMFARTTIFPLRLMSNIIT